MDEGKLTKYALERTYYDKEGRKQAYRNRLRNLLSKKMNTMMIGFIEECEKCFGASWGHGLDYSECTDEQLDKRAIWKICRNNILYFGNKQIRAVQQELEDYTVELRTKEYVFQREKPPQNPE